MDALEARALFDANARTYDRVNTAISFGLDAAWRSWAAERAVRERGDRVLDAYCGSGLTGIASAEGGAAVTFADVSPKMLAVAAERARRKGVAGEFVLANLASPVPALERSSFDAVTAVFGVRYMDEPIVGLRLLARLLAPGGRLVIVEFTQPERPSGPGRLAETYFFRVLPRVASRMAGNRVLYDYLTRSTASMGSRRRLISLVESTGLRVTESRPMGFGLVTGLVAEDRTT